MFIGIAAQFLLQGMRPGQQNHDPDAQQKDVSPPVAQVGDFVITAGMVSNGADSRQNKAGERSTFPDHVLLGDSLARWLTVPTPIDCLRPGD